MGNDNVSLLFAGDYHIYGNYRKVKGKFDRFIKENPNHELFDEELIYIIQNSDLSVFNLEDPISKKKKGIRKNGPHGVGSEESLYPIEKAGFNLATFATNHTYDMGNEGITETVKACSKFSIDITGCGLNKKEARNIYYKTIKNIRIAILNFSRIEFNIVSEKHGGANPLDTIDNLRDIVEAKKNADFLFVIVHEGLDVFQLPYPKLVKQMRFYADMGADAIILHHSRVISGYEIYHETPIFYGIGNLLHYSENPIEHEGLLLKFELRKGRNIDFDIKPVIFDNEQIKVSLLKGKEENDVLERIETLSSYIGNKDLLQNKWDELLETKSTEYLSIMFGYPRLIYRIFKKCKLLPLYELLIKKKEKQYLAMLNILRCQTHLENTKAIIEKMI